MAKKITRKAAKPRETLAQKLDKAGAVGHNEGYKLGVAQTRTEYRPDYLKTGVLRQFASQIEGFKHADPAVAQLFITNGNAHAQAIMPLSTLLAVAGELRRLGY